MRQFFNYAFTILLLAGAGMVASAPAYASEPKEEAAGEGAAGPSFVELKPLVLPVLDADGVSQIISIVVSLETEDAAKAAEVETLKPRLTDAYIQGMYGVLSTKSVMQNGILQVGTIKQKLSRITTKVLGENKVKDVLLQVVQQRRV